ncbi:5755_t:CDS:2, partial [Gigaspora margarita]
EALTETLKQSKTQKCRILSGKLYDMHILSFKDHLQILQQSESLDSLQIEGMKNLPTSLNTFLNDTFTTSIIDNESFIRFYKSATLQNPFYNNNSWFSDIAIVINTNDSYKAATFASAMVK